MCHLLGTWDIPINRIVKKILPSCVWIEMENKINIISKEFSMFIDKCYMVLAWLF